MVSGASNLIEVCVELRSDDPAKAAIAVFDGKTDENGREVWVWLPRSQIEFDEKDYRKKTITVTLPEWLAEQKGLI